MGRKIDSALLGLAGGEGGASLSKRLIDWLIYIALYCDTFLGR